MAKKKIQEVKTIPTDVQWVTIDSITPYEKNAKKHPKDQVEKIANSIMKYGFDQPIVVDQDMVVIKGHGRRLAAKHLGLEQVPIIIRTDMIPAEVRASRIADNATAESYWDMSNLLHEMEVLHGMDESILSDTGYSEDEIKSLMPGLLETEIDYKVSNVEGVIPMDMLMKGPDGLVGKVIKCGDDVTAWARSHEKIIVLFHGDRTGLAAICWCKKNNLDFEVYDFSFGQRVWNHYYTYLEYVEKELNITVINSNGNKLDAFKSGIRSKGFPTQAKLWCCNQFKRQCLLEAAGDTKKDRTLLIVGSCKQDNGVQTHRMAGEFIDSGIHYLAPFCSSIDNELTEIISEYNVKLNPVYQFTDQYLCPGCPAYSSPDFVFLKNYDQDLYIRWIMYIGNGQHCRDYIDSGDLNVQLLSMLGDSIDPRIEGAYKAQALPLDVVQQPIRDTIRRGDNYGFDKEKDAELPLSEQLDIPREKWFAYESYTDGYIALQDECTQVRQKIEEMGYDEYLSETINRAKQEAAEQQSIEDLTDEEED